MSTIWINGRRGANVAATDRGLQYGDGLFETMRVRRRGIRLLDHHLERLAEGCRRLAIAMPNRARLRRELLRAAAMRSEGVLKLIVTRGSGARGYRSTGRERVTRVLSLHALSRQARLATAHPVEVRLCATRLGMNATLAGLKSLNRLESVMARAEWSDPAVWEGLLRDTEDHIICGTMANVFLRRGALLRTPKLDRCGIAGVMRRWVMSEARRLGLRVRESRIRWEDLERADEVFMTNAVAGIVPVAALLRGRVRHRLREQLTASALRARLESV